METHKKSPTSPPDYGQTIPPHSLLLLNTPLLATSRHDFCYNYSFAFKTPQKTSKQGPRRPLSCHMTTIWTYLPITIHLEKSQATEADANTRIVAVSGIYLFNTYTKNYYILAVNDIPDLDKYSFKFTTANLITATLINWFPIYLCDVKYMNNRSVRPNDFMGFVNGLMSNEQFKFKPHDSNYLSLMSFKIAVNIDINSRPIIDPAKMLPLIFQDATTVKAPSKVTIQCCPFSLTNAAIFSNYKIFGSLNYCIRDSGFLSDIRYMDDIIGGVVTLDIHSDNSYGLRRSAGLVCGTLVKSNGDGELLAIISWNKIISTLQLPDMQLTRTFEVPHSNPIDINSLFSLPNVNNSNYEHDPIQSIVRLAVTTSNGQFWGSGVVLSKEYIITNKHVVKLDKLQNISIARVGKQEITLTKRDFAIEPSPLTGFDLCFLRLHIPMEDLVPVKLADTYTSEFNSLKIGQPIKSIGYGLLFYRGDSELKPFHSEGFINSVVDLELDDVGSKEKSLLLVSASCWNGSSGGGLFNLDNELVGIMTSNGKLSSGEILTNFTLAIPINIIIKCIYMLQTNTTPVDVTQKAQDLWSLKNNHESRLIDSITHKL